MNKNRNKLFRLILTGILSGMAIILMMLEFPVAIFPPFYQLDFSDLPALVAGVFINPIYGVLVEGIKILLQLKLALEEIIKDKKVDIELLEEKQKEFYKKVMELNDEIDIEKGISFKTK